MSSPSSTSSNGSKLPYVKKFGARTQFSRSSRLAFGDDDDDQDETEEIAMVAGFEGNRVQELNKKEEAKPLVITPIQSAEDWRTKRRRIYVPDGGVRQQMNEVVQEPEVLGQQTESFGLQVMGRRPAVEDETGPAAAAAESTTINAEAIQETNATAGEEESEPKTLEELAAIALLKEAARTEDDDEESPRSNLVISAAVDETQAFREDMMSRPDEATMDDYGRVPVDQFGAALLRGLGWKEGEGIGRNRKNMPLPKPFEPAKQREALLGLGAKSEDFKNGKKQNRRAAYTYKETSLFKKVAKRRIEERTSDSDNELRERRSRSPQSSSRRDRDRSPSPSHSHSGSRHSSRNRSRSRERSSRHCSSSRHSSSSSRHSNRDKDSSRERSRRRRSRSRDSYRSSRRT